MRREPLRRLVLAGKDKPENMKLIFGAKWAESLQSTYDETRLEVLLNPPPGSPSYAMTSRSGWDEGAPTRAPRPASQAEQTKINQVKEMQTRIRQRLGNRTDPTNADMMAILTAFGAQWDIMLPI